MDKNGSMFPEEVDSDDSESMIGGLGSMAKEPSSIKMYQPESRLFMESDDERSGSVVMTREEQKRSESESQEDEDQLIKGINDDFTDSDEDDLTVRFSKQILSEDKYLPSTLSVAGFNNVQKDIIRSVSVARPSIRKDVLTSNDSHQDYIEKQSPNILKKWQKRYFVLDKRILKYYKSKEDYIA